MGERQGFGSGMDTYAFESSDYTCDKCMYIRGHRRLPLGAQKELELEI
jgi:hypothetical protein